jgi:multiple sugar transport system substrate-binding protein
MNTRIPHALFALGTAALLAAACTPAPKENKIADPGTQVSGTVELWHFFTEREAAAIDTVVKDFESTHPNIKVTVKSGQDDSKVTQAIGAGNGPDIGLSYSTDIVGKFCSSGAWVDLTPYLKRDGVDLNQLNATTRQYTEFGGKRCAMPFLADAYGIFYNKDMFAKAGIAGPPKTLDELTEDAKKLTVKNADGSLKTVGFLPLFDFYENAAAHLAPAVGAKWLTADGKSAIAGDPAWKTLLTWQKSLVDWYGYDKLVRFQAQPIDEFTPSQAFETGKLAMNFDGEWRVAFIHNEHPELDYGTAPMPVDDAHPELYGQGYINGTIIGMPKGGKHQDQAWALVKYLTTADHPLAQLSNGLRNVPTTRSSLTSKEIKPDPHFAPFLRIFANPHSSTSPITASGVAYTNLVQNFATKWQAGKVSDLAKSLSDLDKQLDAQVKQAGGGGVP